MKCKEQEDPEEMNRMPVQGGVFLLSEKQYHYFFHRPDKPSLQKVHYFHDHPLKRLIHIFFSQTAPTKSIHTLYNIAKSLVLLGEYLNISGSSVLTVDILGAFQDWLLGLQNPGITKYSVN